MWRTARVSGFGVLSRDGTFKIYLISLKAGRVRVFAPLEQLEHFEKHANDRLRRIIAWLLASRFSLCLLVWPGSLLLPRWYVRLEARLDPVERILKIRLDSASVIRFVTRRDGKSSPRRSSSSPACDGNA